MLVRDIFEPLLKLDPAKMTIAVIPVSKSLSENGCAFGSS